MTSALIVRPAQPADARRIEEIRVAGWRCAYAGLIDADWLAAFDVTADRVQSLTERITSPSAGATTLVTEEAGSVTGFAVALPCRDEDVADALELAAIYVDPKEHRKGAGSALLAAALDGSSGVQVLWVLEGNAAARRFYERHGFRADGTRKLLDIPGDVPEVRYRRDHRPTQNSLAQ